MSDELKRYMVELASDVGKLADFMLDPRAAMEATGLSKDSQDVLMSGDQGRIYATLKGLPIPAAAPAPSPPQLPTVVATMLQPREAAAPVGGPSAAAGWPVQSPVYYGAVPQPQWQLPPYYVVQWSIWPPS
jgi:hypothetical protein